LNGVSDVLTRWQDPHALLSLNLGGLQIPYRNFISRPMHAAAKRKHEPRVMMIVPLKDQPALVQLQCWQSP
jgi:hypothetical protein